MRNNERRAVNSQVHSIVLKCLEALVKRKPRVYEIASQLFIVKAELSNCMPNPLRADYMIPLTRDYVKRNMILLKKVIVYVVKNV